MQNSLYSRKQFVENLLYVRLDFHQVRQHIHHDSAQLFIEQGLRSRTTCTSKLPFEQAEVRFIFGFIVTSEWIVHAWKGFTIVFCCVVRDLIQNVCFCNGSFYFAFDSKDFLLSLNQVAPMSLYRPPIRASYGRCKIICCIGLKKPGGKIFSNLQSNTEANFSICSTTARDNSLAHSWRKKLLNSASTCQTWSGRQPRTITRRSRSIHMWQS